MNPLTRRIAARGFAAQITALGHADAAGDAAEQLVSRTWRNLLDLLSGYAGWHDLQRIHTAVLHLFGPLHTQLVHTIAASAINSGAQSFDMAADAMAEQLPRPVVNQSLGESRIREDETGLGLLGLSPWGATDLAAPFAAGDLSGDAARDLFKALIFPPPSLDRVRGVVFQSGWASRIGMQTGLAQPNVIAALVTHNLAQGKKINDLARQLLPAVDGVRSTARRIARDETMHAAHAMQHEAWNKVGDLVVGFQIHAVLDERTRPAHRARDGQLFYKQPKGDQRGMDECPQPPRESPADGSKWAFNCRCFVAPVLSIGQGADVFEVPTAPLDRELTADWFSNASERDRTIAVGAERYHLAKDVLGRVPTWQDFTTAGGQLLPIDALRSQLAA